MICSFDELRRKEVIDIKTGERMGFIDDIEINISDGRAERFIIYGGVRFFGILGKEDDAVIDCTDIKVVGRDIVLVDKKDRFVSSILPKKDEKSSESLF